VKLYTINATPVLSDNSVETNDFNCQAYPQRVAGILKKHGIDGFTIYLVTGYWQGEEETSFKIEIATELDSVVMFNICNELRTRFNQESVMLTYPSGNVEFIDGK